MSVNRREKENSCRAGNDHKLKKGEIVASTIEPMCLCLIYEIMGELELLVLYVYIWKTKLFCLLCHVVNCTSSNLIPLLCGCEIAKQKLSLDSIALQHFSSPSLGHGKNEFKNRRLEFFLFILRNENEGLLLKTGLAVYLSTANCESPPPVVGRVSISAHKIRWQILGLFCLFHIEILFNLCKNKE